MAGSVRIGDGQILNTMTVVGPKTAVDVNIAAGGVTGEIQPLGLKTDIKAQSLTITDIASKIPSAALTGRNGLTVRVWGTNTVFFGDASVTTTEGYPKFQYEEISLDIQSNPTVALWAVCATGETSEVRILEVA